MYIKRLFIIILITFTVAYATGIFFDHTYQKRWATIFFDKTDALVKDSSYHEVVFFGDSRVHFGINPYYVDSVANISSYNFGFGGSDVEDIMLTCNVYLQHHRPPKLAILSLDMGGMTKNETLKTRFHYLYYLRNDSVSKYMNRAGFLTTLMKVLPFTKYSFFDEYNRTSLFNKGNQIPAFGHNIYKGFLNIHQDINIEAVNLYNVKKRFDSLWAPAAGYIRNTVAALVNKGITVVLVTPPEKQISMYKGTDFRRITDSIFVKVANDYHLKFFRFEYNPLFTDSYFVDDVHLNEPGSRIYSMQLADSIKTIYPFIK